MLVVAQRHIHQRQESVQRWRQHPGERIVPEVEIEEPSAIDEIWNRTSEGIHVESHLMQPEDEDEEAGEGAQEDAGNGVVGEAQGLEARELTEEVARVEAGDAGGAGEVVGDGPGRKGVVVEGLPIFLKIKPPELHNDLAAQQPDLHEDLAAQRPDLHEDLTRTLLLNDLTSTRTLLLNDLTFTRTLPPINNFGFIQQ
ncbi:hypothetical protein ACLOJK_022399 [Asimina triloba]